MATPRDVGEQDPIRVSLELTWPAANPVDAEQLRQHLVRTYDRAPSDLVALDNAWRADWPGAGEPSWIVRVASKHRPFASVAADAALLTYLSECGLPAERCAADPPVAPMGKRAVGVTVVEHGREADDTDETWIRLGHLAGRLAAVPSPPSGLAIARDIGAYPNQTPRLSLRDEISHVAACLRAIEHEVPAELADLYAALRTYVGAPTDFDELPRGLVHPDLAPANAFETPDRGLVLVDWAGAGIGPRIGTLGVLLAYTTLSRGGWLADRARDLTSAFLEHVPLEEQERRAIAPLAERRLFVREAVGLCIGVRFGVPPLYRHQWSGQRAAMAELADVVMGDRSRR